MLNVTSRRARSRGFTLIELLIVVAIIGIIAAIAIPNLFSALQKARQKKTMSDMRTVAGALQIYSLDNSHFPRIGDTQTINLQPFLSDILNIVPYSDAWSTSMPYLTDDAGSEYTMISFGSNRVEDLPYTYGFTQRYRDDIVYSSTVFVQWPEGVQYRE